MLLRTMPMLSLMPKETSQITIFLSSTFGSMPGGFGSIGVFIGGSGFIGAFGSAGGGCTDEGSMPGGFGSIGVFIGGIGFIGAFGSAGGGCTDGMGGIGFVGIACTLPCWCRSAACRKTTDVSPERPAAASLVASSASERLRSAQNSSPPRSRSAPAITSVRSGRQRESSQPVAVHSPLASPLLLLTT